MKAGRMKDGHYSHYRSCKCLIPGSSRMVSILNECSGAGIHIFTLGVIKLQCWRGIRQSGCLPNNALSLCAIHLPNSVTQTEHLFWVWKCKNTFPKIRAGCSKTRGRRRRDYTWMCFAFRIEVIFQPRCACHIFPFFSEALNWCWKGNKAEYFFFLAHQHPREQIWQTCERWENSWLLAVEIWAACVSSLRYSRKCNCSREIHTAFFITYQSNYHQCEGTPVPSFKKCLWKWDAAFLVFFDRLRLETPFLSLFRVVLVPYIIWLVSQYVWVFSWWRYYIKVLQNYSFTWYSTQNLITLMCKGTYVKQENII